MNSKKLVAVISAVIIFAVLLASCSFKLPIPGRETTTSQTETSAEPQPDLSIWQDKYEEFLLGIINGTQSVIGYELELDECRFDIRAIDSDEICGRGHMRERPDLSWLPGRRAHRSRA